MFNSIYRFARRFTPLAAIAALILAMDGTWATAQPVTKPVVRPIAAAAPQRPAAAASAASDPDERAAPKSSKQAISGKLNLNTATEDQLMMLPSVGPSKAERIVVWRKKNGGFKRTADLRRVKGFGYKTFKRLAPFLDIQGETTLAAKP